MAVMLLVRSSLNWATAHDVLHTKSYWESFVSNLQSRDVQGDSGRKKIFGQIIASVLEERPFEYVSNYEGMPNGSKGTVITYI